MSYNAYTMCGHPGKIYPVRNQTPDWLLESIKNTSGFSNGVLIAEKISNYCEREYFILPPMLCIPSIPIFSLSAILLKRGEYREAVKAASCAFLGLVPAFIAFQKHLCIEGRLFEVVNPVPTRV